MSAIKHPPRAELYGFPIRARTNLSSLLKENRRTASNSPSSSWESPMLQSQPLDQIINRNPTHAAKISARSAYCQYSRLGIGSRSDAGSDRRLRYGSISYEADLWDLFTDWRHLSHQLAYGRTVSFRSLHQKEISHFFNKPNNTFIFPSSPPFPTSGRVAGAPVSSVNV